jgi:hypothetical protein
MYIPLVIKRSRSFHSFIPSQRCVQAMTNHVSWIDTNTVLGGTLRKHEIYPPFVLGSIPSVVLRGLHSFERVISNDHLWICMLGLLWVGLHLFRILTLEGNVENLQIRVRTMGGVGKEDQNQRNLWMVEWMVLLTLRCSKDTASRVK